MNDTHNGDKKKVKKPKQQQPSFGEFFISYWWLFLIILVALTGVIIGVFSLFDSTVEFFEDRLLDKQTLEIGSGALKLMWATPIFTLNLYNNSRIMAAAAAKSSPDSPIPKLDTQALNKALHAAVVKEFDQFLLDLAARDSQGTSKSGSSSRAYNELFFAWQRDSWENKGRTAMDKYPEFRHLKAIMKSAATTFLDMTGRVMPDDTDMFSWATIHRECMFHLAHTHPHNLVSGVYYARVPNGAGDIIFDDPRGPLPPFENRIIYTPKEGDLIVFPSWLLHQVSPTLGDEERISFSFNIPGDWTQTADVSLTIPFT